MFESMSRTTQDTFDITPINTSTRAGPVPSEPHPATLGHRVSFTIGPIDRTTDNEFEFQHFHQFLEDLHPATLVLPALPEPGWAGTWRGEGRSLEASQIDTSG